MSSDIELTGRFKSAATEINDESLRNLVNYFGSLSEFQHRPAAVYYHHVCDGGLLQHSVETAEIAKSIADAMQSPVINRDIVIAGALIHDIGKMDSYERREHDGEMIYVQTENEHLLDHRLLGCERLMQAILDYGYGCNQVHVQMLLHIIMSHHGQYGDVRPKFPEAHIVHLADLVSATVDNVIEDYQHLKVGEYVRKAEHGSGALYRIA